MRLNYDRKEAFYDAQIYGGLQTSNRSADRAAAVDPRSADLLGRRRRHQRHRSADHRLPSTDWINTYATYATGKKSIGVNLGGVPTDALGNPILSAATVKPEDTRHIEVGIKTEPFEGVRANLTYFNTTIEDYQTQVVNAQVGVLRGYLANAEKVRVQGFEFDSAAQIGKQPLRLRFGGLHRRRLCLLSRCAGTAGTDRRAASRRRVGNETARHLQMGRRRGCRVFPAGTIPSSE